MQTTSRRPHFHQGIIRGMVRLFMKRVLARRLITTPVSLLPFPLTLSTQRTKPKTRRSVARKPLQLADGHLVRPDFSGPGNVVFVLNGDLAFVTQKLPPNETPAVRDCCAEGATYETFIPGGNDTWIATPTARASRCHLPAPPRSGPRLHLTPGVDEMSGPLGYYSTVILRVLSEDLAFLIAVSVSFPVILG